MMKKLRQRGLQAFIVFLVISAVVAITTVLGRNFGPFRRIEVQTLFTTFTIAAGSVCFMSCAAFAEKKRRYLFPAVGMVCAGIGVLLVITGIWARFEYEWYWKPTGIIVLFAVAFAHYFLLGLVNLKGSHRWVQHLTAVFAFGLALLLSVMIAWDLDGEGMIRWVIVSSILVALNTVVIPILAKIDKDALRRLHELALVRVEGDLFEDRHGRAYRVVKVEPVEEVVDPSLGSMVTEV